MPNFFDESGNVTEDFRTELPTMLGADHTESKMFNDIIDREDKSEASDIALMIKSSADTKAMVGKKMENVIHKPADDASETDKAEFTKTLRIHLGAAEKPEDYELTKPTLPEGMSYKDETEQNFRKWGIEKNIPKSIMADIADYYNEMQIETFNAGAEAAKATLAEKEEQWQKDCEEFSEKHPGVELTKSLRTILNAIETFNKRNPELLKKLKESDLYTHPENYEAWRKAGFDIHNLWGWEEIGEALLAGTFERGNAIKEGDSEATKGLKGMYNHPTSARLFNQK